MPRVAKGKKKGKKDAKKAEEARRRTVAKLPKKKCCESKSRCNRCPLRMLKEGTLPQGYTVHKRKLVQGRHQAGVACRRGRSSTKAA